MSNESITAIIIAVIGGGFGVWSAWVSNKNQKATRDITSVLSNTKTPVDSLDQVVRLLQEELNRTNKAHETERQFFNDEIMRLRNEHRADREDWERAEFKMQSEINTLINERGKLLKEIGLLKEQLTTLENQVRASLEGVKRLEDI